MIKFTQAPQSVMMIRPAAFGFNRQTADTNPFQTSDEYRSTNIPDQALLEFNRMVKILSDHGVSIELFEDTVQPEKPDAVFPNNWVSFHEDGKVVLYPVMAENRRKERRMDIIEILKNKYVINEIIDLTDYENSGRFLEGTGSIVFDHTNRIAYACYSQRTDRGLVQLLCHRLGYTPILFNAIDEKNKPVYHTNVMMSVGTRFAVVCLDAIHDENEQELLLQKFSSTHHKVIAISYQQMYSFAGNIFEVQLANGDTGVLISNQAFNTLLPGQIDAISKFAELIPIAIPTIEKFGGGSVRCMVAGIHLRSKIEI